MRVEGSAEADTICMKAELASSGYTRVPVSLYCLRALTATVVNLLLRALGHPFMWLPRPVSVPLGGDGGGIGGNSTKRKPDPSYYAPIGAAFSRLPIAKSARARNPPLAGAHAGV